MCWALPLPRFLDSCFTSISIGTPFRLWVVCPSNTLIMHDFTLSLCTALSQKVRECGWPVLRPEKHSGGHSLSCDLVEAPLPALQGVRTGRNENTGPCAFSKFWSQEIINCNDLMPQKTTDYVDGEFVIWKASICQEYNYFFKCKQTLNDRFFKQ